MFLRTSDMRSGSESGSEGEGSTGPRFMRIDITTDVVCAYSLVGVRQLLLAIDIYNSQTPHSPIQPLIRMLPYQLFPKLSEIPSPRREFKRRMYSGDMGLVQIGDERAIEKLAQVGIIGSMDGLISSTFLAHRLQILSLLRYPSRHLQLALDLMMAFHTTTAHPSDKSLLAHLSIRHCLFDTHEEAIEWLNGDEYSAEVKKAYGVARRLGVTGCPFFVFQGRWAASGAIGVEECLRLLYDIVRREKSGSLSPSPTSSIRPRSMTSDPSATSPRLASASLHPTATAIGMGAKPQIQVVAKGDSGTSTQILGMASPGRGITIG